MSNPDPIAAARAAADIIESRELFTAINGRLRDHYASAIRTVCDELEREQEKVRRLTEDWADDDTTIREACRAVLGDVVDGDREYRPAMAELCERVCDALTAARERIAELESRGKPINWPFVDKPKPADGTLRC